MQVSLGEIDNKDKSREGQPGDEKQLTVIIITRV